MATTAIPTVQSSELSRNSRKVFRAADDGPVLITRRDGEPLVLTRASRAETDQHGLRLASALVAASLSPDQRPLAERLTDAFPWVTLLSDGDRAVFAQEIVQVARACAAVASYGPLLKTLRSWEGTAQALAAGFTPAEALEWLDGDDDGTAVRDPRA